MEKRKQGPGTSRDDVLQEFAPLGKYRVRLLKDAKNPSGDPLLDIREYVSSDTFEGFTRRGIRLADRGQIDLLRDTLGEVLERNGTAKPAPGTRPLA